MRHILPCSEFFLIQLSLHRVPFEILATQRLYGEKQIHLTVINVCLPKQILMSDFDETH